MVATCVTHARSILSDVLSGKMVSHFMCDSMLTRKGTSAMTLDPVVACFLHTAIDDGSESALSLAEQRRQAALPSSEPDEGQHISNLHKRMRWMRSIQSIWIMRAPKCRRACCSCGLRASDICHTVPDQDNALS
jgi:hypothetical protein